MAGKKKSKDVKSEKKRGKSGTCNPNKEMVQIPSQECKVVMFGLSLILWYLNAT